MTRNHSISTILAGFVHLYTASGLLVALFALIALSRGDFPSAFLLLFLATFIDYTDGTLARFVRVRQHMPWVDGDHLNTAVDIVVVGFLPTYLLLQIQAIPDPVWLWAGLVLCATLYRFAVANPIQEHGFFWGLPPFWNVAAFYIFYYRPGALVTATVFLGYTLLCVLPFGYVHTGRFKRLKTVNILALAAWWVVYLVVTQDLVAGQRLWLTLSLLYPLYYLVISVYFYRKFQREQAAAVVAESQGSAAA